jgi:hypothetical protein
MQLANRTKTADTQCRGSEAHILQSWYGMHCTDSLATGRALQTVMCGQYKSCELNDSRRTVDLVRSRWTFSVSLIPIFSVFLNFIQRLVLRKEHDGSEVGSVSVFR